jgi:hypothetical protein
VASTLAQDRRWHQAHSTRILAGRVANAPALDCGIRLLHVNPSPPEATLQTHGPQKEPFPPSSPHFSLAAPASMSIPVEHEALELAHAPGPALAHNDIEVGGRQNPARHLVLLRVHVNLRYGQSR